MSPSGNGQFQEWKQYWGRDHNEYFQFLNKPLKIPDLERFEDAFAFDVNSKNWYYVYDEKDNGHINGIPTFKPFYELIIQDDQS